MKRSGGALRDAAALVVRPGAQRHLLPFDLRRKLDQPPRGRIALPRDVG